MFMGTSKTAIIKIFIQPVFHWRKKASDSCLNIVLRYRYQQLKGKVKSSV